MGVLNSTSIKNCCQINFFAEAEQQTYVMMHSPALDTMLCPQNNMTLHQQSALSSSWQQRVSSCYSNLNQLNMIVGGPLVSCSVQRDCSGAAHRKSSSTPLKCEQYFGQ